MRQPGAEAPWDASSRFAAVAGVIFAELRLSRLRSVCSARATPEPRWPESFHPRTVRIEFAIVQQQPQGQPGSDQHPVTVPTRRAPDAPPQPLAESASGVAPEPEVQVVPQRGNPGLVPTDSDRLILFSTRYATYVPAGLPVQSASGPAFGVLPTADGGKVVWALR